MMTRIWSTVPLLVASLAHSQPEAFTNTEYVEDLLVHRGSLWVATRGGLEQYDLDDLKSRRVYTTLDGLAANEVRSVGVRDGRITARTDAASCGLSGGRFRCRPEPASPPPEPSVSGRFAGSRVTRSFRANGLTLIGTAGAGVWIGGGRPRRITPENQVCSNHVTAMHEFGGKLWLATFDDGLCSWDGATFDRANVPIRMVNDLVATPEHLYVAASEGLWRTEDGQSFERVAFVGERGVNDLAYDERYVWATTPGALWRIATKPWLRSRTYWRPGGTRALQAVAAGGRDIWLATEDRGALRLRRDGFSVFDRATGLPTSWALDVAVGTAGPAWIATLRHGLQRIDERGRASSVPGLPDQWLLFVSTYGNDGLWVGTQNGAARVRADGTVAAVAGLPHPCVHAILPTRNSVWFATEGGLLRQPGGETPAPGGSR